MSAMNPDRAGAPRGPAARRQRGAVLVMTLIMLLLFTLLLSGAFAVSTSNLQMIGNLQSREEALAAANRVIEDVLATDFIGTGLQRFTVDIDNDGSADYQVEVPAPRCMRAIPAASRALSSVTLGSLSGALWDTLWILEAAASGGTAGASVRVRVGVRRQLADAGKRLHCDAPGTTEEGG